MELSKRLVNHFLASPARLWENSLALISSWSTSSRFVQSENHPKCSSAEYTLYPLNCLNFLAYPWGRSWRTVGRSIGANLLAFPGVIIGFARGIEVGVIDGINVLRGTAELWGAVKLDDEGCLISKVVGERDREVGWSVELELNEANSEENKWHSWSKKSWRSLPRDSEKDAVSIVAPWVLQGWSLFLSSLTEGSWSKSYVKGEEIPSVLKEGCTGVDPWPCFEWNKPWEIYLTRLGMIEKIYEKG